MRARRTKLLALSLVVVALAMVGTLAVPEADAIGPCRCGQTSQTGVEAGYGYTCSEAEADLEVALLDDPLLCVIDGFCSKEVVITEECHAHTSQLVEVKGYLEYSCKACF